MNGFDYSIGGARASASTSRQKPAAPAKGKTTMTTDDHTATSDGLDHLRRTGGAARWGKGIKPEDYKKLSTAQAMVRALAIKAGQPWPSLVAPTRRQQFAEWARIGRATTAK